LKMKENFDVQQQTNGYDCGVFTLWFAKMILEDNKINFKEEKNKDFRIKIWVEGKNLP